MHSILHRMDSNDWGIPAYAIDLSRTSLGFRLVLIAITLAACTIFFMCETAGVSSDNNNPPSKPTLFLLPTT
jgi:hypothetical protein